MNDVIYNIADEQVFDGMAKNLEDMSEQEKQNFMLLMQGYQAGVKVGMRISVKEENEPA